MGWLDSILSNSLRKPSFEALQGLAGAGAGWTLVTSSSSHPHNHFPNQSSSTSAQSRYATKTMYSAGRSHYPHQPLQSSDDRAEIIVKYQLKS